MKRLLLSLALLFSLTVLFFLNPLIMRVMTVGVAWGHHLNAGRFYRLIQAESSFRPWVRSHRDAVGLGQVRQETAYFIYVGHDERLLWFPPYNLHISALYLKYLLKRYHGNWSIALAAYNWGETNVDQRLRKMSVDYGPNTDCRAYFQDIPETRTYLNKILR
jgi:soluble lytic murein transglycosylase